MLDVRSDDEREDPGRIPGSLHVPRKFDSRKFAFRKWSGKLVTIIKKYHFEIRLQEALELPIGLNFFTDTY